MEKILLRTYALLLITYSSVCYNIPAADFVIYPKGFSISIPDEQGIEIFFFYGSVNKVACNFQPDSIILSASKSSGGKWVLENTDKFLTRGQIIYYWLYVKKDGVGYTRHDNFYNVTDISPYNLPYPESKDAEITTTTRLTSDPIYMKPSSDSTAPPKENKSPSDNLIPGPVVNKPVLNLNPYYIEKRPVVPNINPGRLPFPHRIPTKDDDSSNKTQLSLYMHTNNTEIAKRNCSNSQSEINKEPFSTDSNHNCHHENTSSQFNSRHTIHTPSVPHSEESTTETPKHKFASGELWYWS